MTENPPEKEDLESKDEKLCEEKEKSSWSEDQKTRNYYYDDAHGYEIYNADEEETDED